MIFLHMMFTFFVVAYFASNLQVQYALSPVQRTQGLIFTFVVDPLTFLAVGFFSVLVSIMHLKGRALTQIEFRTRKKWLDRLFILFVAAFWTVEILTYFDLLNMHHGIYPDKTGNWFMWNGYLDMMGLGELFDTSTPTYRSPLMNLLALLLLMVQLPCLIYARRMGYSVGWLLDWNNWCPPKRKNVS